MAKRFPLLNNWQHCSGETDDLSSQLLTALKGKPLKKLLCPFLAFDKANFQKFIFNLIEELGVFVLFMPSKQSLSLARLLSSSELTTLLGSLEPMQELQILLPEYARGAQLLAHLPLELVKFIISKIFSFANNDFVSMRIFSYIQFFLRLEHSWARFSLF